MTDSSKREARDHFKLQTTKIQKITFYPLSPNFWLFPQAKEYPGCPEVERARGIILITTSRTGAGLWCFRREQEHAWSEAKIRHSGPNPVKTRLVKAYQATHTYVANKVTIKENRWRFINSVFAVFSKFPKKTEA